MDDKAEYKAVDPINPQTEHVTGMLGQMLGGIGSGLGQAFAQKLNERLILTAAALAGQLANPTNSGDLDLEANEAVNYADAVIKRMEAREDAEDARFERSGAKTEYHDAVQRLTESCDSFAERLKGHEREFFMARIEAVREAGKALYR